MDATMRSTWNIILTTNLHTKGLEWQGGRTMITNYDSWKADFRITTLHNFTYTYTSLLAMGDRRWEDTCDNYKTQHEVQLERVEIEKQL